MITLETKARVNASNFNWIGATFEFDPDEPFIIGLTIHDRVEDIDWEIGRSEIRDAVFSNWPSGTHDVIMIRFGKHLRMYLKGVENKFTLDFKVDKIRTFLQKTYKKVSDAEEQAHIEEEIDKWTSN